MLYNVLLIIQIVVSVGIIVLVLMQQGKGADAGAAFGSGASGTVFGAQGSANFLSRTTAILATVFFANCIALAFIASGHKIEAGSIMDSVMTQEAKSPATTPAANTNTDVPAAPAAKAVTGDVPAAPVADKPADKPAADANVPAKDEKPVQEKK